MSHRNQLCYHARQHSCHETSLLHHLATRRMGPLVRPLVLNLRLFRHRRRLLVLMQRRDLLLRQRIKTPRQCVSGIRGRIPRVRAMCKASWTVGIRKQWPCEASNSLLGTSIWPYYWPYPYLKQRRPPLLCCRHRLRPRLVRPRHPRPERQERAARARGARLLDSCQRLRRVAAATMRLQGQEAEV